MKKTLYIITLSLLVFSGCTSASEIDLIDKQAEPEKVTYDDNVKTIITNNCIFCHSDPPVNGAPISLTTYSMVKAAVQNSNLINRVSAQAGAPGAMPFGGPRLPQNLIDLIIQWKDDGLLED